MSIIAEIVKWGLLLGALLLIGLNLSDRHLDNLASTIADMPTILVIVILSLVVVLLLKAVFKSGGE